MATIVFLRPTRAGFHSDPTQDELAALSAHLEFLSGMLREGRIVLAGPCEDGSLGVVVFPHDDASCAEQIMRKDPCVTAGVMTLEVHPFRMTLFGTGTKRDWMGFTQAIHIRAEPVELWRMLATCEGLERWFLTRASARTADGRDWPRNRELEPGLALRMTWICGGEGDARGVAAPAESSEENAVLAVEAPQRLRIGWYEDRGWVDIRLLPHTQGRVTVELQQRMNPTRDFALLEGAYVGCREGWAFYLANLKCMAEGGADLRDRAPDRKSLINA